MKAYMKPALGYVELRPEESIACPGSGKCKCKGKGKGGIGMLR